jgi:hypothetical protein
MKTFDITPEDRQFIEGFRQRYGEEVFTLAFGQIKPCPMCNRYFRPGDRKRRGGRQRICCSALCHGRRRHAAEKQSCHEA